MKKIDNKASSRSWFCVLNNPQEIYQGEPHEIAEKCLEDWVSGYPTRSGAVAYCISALGLIHLHMVLEDSSKARFSALKNAYPKAHLEPTIGNKRQAEDYINKRGKYQEKGEQVIYIAKYGEIKGNQGARRDFEQIEDLIEQGITPREVMSQSFSYRRYEKMIKQAYYEKRRNETPFLRDIKVIWHVDESGSGKSYVASQIVDEKGEDSIYMYSDFETGGLDDYCGEPILFMDEFRGQIQFSILLKMLQGYRQPMHARYTNITPLWSEVHIASVLPPEKVYEKMVSENRSLDSKEQLFRRITTVIYHYKQDTNYFEYETPMCDYTNYKDLIS